MSFRHVSYTSQSGHMTVPFGPYMYPATQPYAFQAFANRPIGECPEDMGLRSRIHVGLVGRHVYGTEMRRFVSERHLVLNILLENPPNHFNADLTLFQYVLQHAVAAVRRRSHTESSVPSGGSLLRSVASVCDGKVLCSYLWQCILISHVIYIMLYQFIKSI